MAGTREGGLKQIDTNIRKHGSYEAWQEFMRNAGRKGGSAPHSKPRGFASLRVNDPERLKQISKLGGAKGKRK